MPQANFLVRVPRERPSPEPCGSLGNSWSFPGFCASTTWTLSTRHRTWRLCYRPPQYHHHSKCGAFLRRAIPQSVGQASKALVDSHDDAALLAPQQAASSPFPNGRRNSSWSDSIAAAEDRRQLSRRHGRLPPAAPVPRPAARASGARATLPALRDATGGLRQSAEPRPRLCSLVKEGKLRHAAGDSWRGVGRAYIARFGSCWRMKAVRTGSNSSAMFRIGKCRLLFGHATCFVFPSLLEACGTVLIEALACGTPILCCRRRPMSDICGDAAVLFDGEIPRTSPPKFLRWCPTGSPRGTLPHGVGARQAILLAAGRGEGSRLLHKLPPGVQAMETMFCPRKGAYSRRFNSGSGAGNLCAS